MKVHRLEQCELKSNHGGGLNQNPRWEDWSKVFFVHISNSNGRVKERGKLMNNDGFDAWKPLERLKTLASLTSHLLLLQHSILAICFSLSNNYSSGLIVN